MLTQHRQHFQGISTHAPTKAATPLPFTITLHRGFFNPRSHNGSDSAARCRVITSTDYFNPRSHKGSDPTAGISLDCFTIDFNPRSHKGSDWLRRLVQKQYKEFQPTLPQRERRNGQQQEEWQLQISTHAPTKGATELLLVPLQHTEISTHAPTKGATEVIFMYDADFWISTHAPTKGAT